MILVLPDAPTTLSDYFVVCIPLRAGHAKAYTSHEVTASRAGSPSGRTSL